MRGKRTNQHLSRQEQDDDQQSSLNAGKQTPLPASQPEDWRLEASIVSLLTLTDEDNRLICPPFRILPTLEEFPLYYQLIKKPIDLKKIAEQIREGKYPTWQSLEADIQLMCKNAREFNEPGSMIYKDAARLLQHFQSIMVELAETRRFSQRVMTRNKETINELLRSSPHENIEYSEDSEEDEDSEKSDDPKWKLYWTLRNYDVVDGVPLCENFMELPSKRNYPDYYEEIERPISFYIINKKLKRGRYKDLYALVEDLLLMFENACEYNMDGSEIFLAAVRLRKVTLETVKLLDPGFNFKQKSLINSDQIKKEESIESENSTRNIKESSHSSIASPAQKRRKLAINSSLPKNNKIKEVKKKEDEPSIVGDEEQQASCSNSIKLIEKKNLSENRQSNLEKPKKGRKSIEELRDKFTKTLVDVWQDVRDLKMGNRTLSEPFLYLPCDRTFPDYYKSIEKPISLNCIRSKIDEAKYNCSDEMLNDIKLMCENARKYNRPSSQIYNDSSILESVATGSMQSKNDGANIYYPMRRADKGWTEQSSITNKFKSKGSGGVGDSSSTNTTTIECENGKKNIVTQIASTSAGTTVLNNSLNLAAVPPTNFIHQQQLILHPHFSGVYIAALPPQSSSQQIEKNKKLTFMDLAKKLNFREQLSREMRQMFTMLEAILLFRNDEDRYLAETFVELPSKEEYEDYYNVIKNPMDLSRIVNKLIGQHYECFRPFIADLRLVFENACKYNEPKSSIYADAIIFLREIVKMRQQLFDENKSQGAERPTISVQKEVNQILRQLLNSLFEHKDEQGRSYHESLNRAFLRLEDQIKKINNEKTVDKDKEDACPKLPFSLAKIQKNLENGLYKRLDRFQEDCFTLFSHVRDILEADSKEFFDIVELQRHFIRKRDFLCKNVLFSPASQFTESLLEEELAELQKQKGKKEKQQKAQTDLVGKQIYHQNGTIEGMEIAIDTGEIASNSGEENSLENDNNLITKEAPDSRMFNNTSTNEMEMNDIKEDGNGRKEREQIENNNVTDVCFNNNYQQEAKSAQSIDDDGQEIPTILDIHREEVLDRRQQNIHNFEKQSTENCEIEAAINDMNVYYQQIEHNGRFYKFGDGVLVYKEGKPHCEVMRIDRLWKNSNGEKMFSGCRFARPTELKHEPSKMFYKQEVVALMAVDVVERMENVQNRCAILTLKQYEQYRPTEIPDCDVFLVEQKVLGPIMLGVDGFRVPLTWKNCSVIAARSGQITTQTDDELNDSREMDLNNARVVRKIRQYNLLHEVIEDEIFYFKHPLLMEKILSPLIMNPSSSDHTLPVTHGEIDDEEERLFSTGQQQQRIIRKQQQHFLNSPLPNEDELMYENDHEGDEFIHTTTNLSQLNCNINNNNDGDLMERDTSNEAGAFSQHSVDIFDNDQQSRQDGKSNAGQNSLYTPTPSSSSSTVVAATPKSRNGNPKLKNTSWLDTQPKLNAKSKSGYILFSAEVRKRVMNENPDAGFGEVSKIVGIEWKRLSDVQKRQYETRAQFIAEERAKADLLTPNSKMPQSGQIRVHCCRWQQCDFQFDTQEGLYEHIRLSHTSISEAENQHVCLWNSCLKYRKEGKPFPSLPRLHRHIKEKHLVSSIRFMFPNQRTKNFFVYLSTAQSSVSISSSAPHKDSIGRFVHHPYGEVPTNPIPCSVATPTFSMNSTSSNQSSLSSGIGGPLHYSAISPHSHSQSRYMSPTNVSSKIGYGGGSLLNGTMLPQPSTSSSFSQQSHGRKPISQQQQQIGAQPIQQQTVVIPSGQQAIVINGTTVYIPANAHTIILPPGYTGPQQTHQLQIVVHSQQQQLSQPQQHPSTMNGPMSSNSAIQHPQQIPNIVQQQQQHPHQIVIQQPQQNATPAQHHQIHQQQNLVNGVSTSTQFISAASALTSHNSVSSLSGAIAQQQLFSPQTTLPAHQSIQQQQHTTHSIQQSTPSSHLAQPQQLATAPGAIAQQHAYIDPGRTVLTTSKPPEPVFIAPSNSITVKRAVHSEAYVRYLESIYGNGNNNPNTGRTQHVRKWDKLINVSQKNTFVPNNRKLPYEWIKHAAEGSKPKEEEMVHALWQLRNHLIEGTTGIEMQKTNTTEATAPQPPGYDEAISSYSNNNNNVGGGVERKKGCS